MVRIYLTLFISIKVSMFIYLYIKMNWAPNEFECGFLGAYFEWLNYEIKTQSAKFNFIYTPIHLLFSSWTNKKGYIYIYIYNMFDEMGQLLCVRLFYLSPFKFSYESFDFWMEWIQEDTVFLLRTFSPNWSYLRVNIKEMTNTVTSHVHLYKELKEEPMGG